MDNCMANDYDDSPDILKLRSQECKLDAPNFIII